MHPQHARSEHFIWTLAEEKYTEHVVDACCVCFVMSTLGND